jgi:long-chain acyl-CoA synthetase
MTPSVAQQGATLDRLLQEPTLCSAFLTAAEAQPDRIALREFGSERTVTLGEWASGATRIAGGLRALGVERGDRVALLLSTRLDFHLVDMGAVLAGAAPFSLYVTSPVEQLAPCIGNAMPRVLITEASLAGNARALQAACPVIEHLVVIDETAPGQLSLEALADLSPQAFDAREAAEQIQPDDLCSLLYTSGTSGPPKGVSYVHRALMTTMASIHERVPVSRDGRTVSYLPMAHIAERLFGHYAAFVFGYSVTALPDPAQLAAALREVRPTRFFGVPRIWEKLLAGLEVGLASSPRPDHAEALRAAWRRGIARVEVEQAGEPVAPELEAARAEDDRLLAELPSSLGLDCVEWACVAGAPAGRSTIAAFHAIGVRVNELYGMSETIMTTMCPPDRIRIGTSGSPLPGVKLKLAGDGEILIGGPTVMPGYFRDAERTREVLDDEGWMHSGDIGELDEDGYLRIVDRKKALIINSSGKNMSPATIEQAIRGGVPFLSQVVVFGDRRPYNVALLVLDSDGLAALCRAQGIPAAPLAELARHPQVLAAVDDAVRRGNSMLSRVEQIKRYAVLDHVWRPADFALTPTAKLKRAQIAERYAGLIDGLYA